MSKVCIISLGCARNLVDSEVIAGGLKRKGNKIVDIDHADIALVNTCAFIKEAKEESINVVLDLINLKKEDKLKKILVAGCLTQRYKQQLLRHLPEVDAFIGIQSLNHTLDRFPLAASHYAYVKISEGCINNCSFCAIPSIKGSFVSRSIESILGEVKTLDARFCREINIIGQDISAYGLDLYKKFRLVELLQQILFIRENSEWIRILYLSPERVSKQLMNLIASSQRIVKYVDIPLQHVNNRILKSMGRNFTSSSIHRLIQTIRDTIAGVALRTSLIVGFPGEGEKEFSQLLKFIQDNHFERLGLFMYSREEDTAAYSFKGHVPERTKEKRYNIIMSKQQDIAREINQR